MKNTIPYISSIGTLINNSIKNDTLKLKTNKFLIMFLVLLWISILSITPLQNTSAAPSTPTPTYHSGLFWSNDLSHSNEFHNGNIPFAIDKERLSNHLELSPNTTIENIYGKIEGSISLIDDTTNANLERYDTSTQDYDNVITSQSLPLGTHAVTKTWYHWNWNFLQSGFDNHFLKAKIILDDDSRHGTWDHEGYNRLAKERNTGNVVLHELGHTIGLCDTYNSGNQNIGDCTGVIDSTSIMSNNGVYMADRNFLTSTDIIEINGHY